MVLPFCVSCTDDGVNGHIKSLKIPFDVQRQQQICEEFPVSTVVGSWKAVPRWHNTIVIEFLRAAQALHDNSIDLWRS